MVRIGRQVEPFVMSSVVVAESQSLIRAHILIDIEQTLNRSFHIYKLTEMENRTVYKEELTADKSFVCTPFVIGQPMGLHDRTGVNKLLELLKIDLNSQIG